jgi:putative ABC transport system substrate-binding protein
VGSVNYDLPDAVERAAKAGVDAVILASSFVYYESRAGVAQASLKHRLPLIAFAREFVEVGALLSYGVSIPDTWRRAADYVARIAKGANPGDLPIEQPTRFELVVNGRTASSLGLNLPTDLLGRADELIE